MIFINKPIVITHHAKERFKERRVNMNNINKKNYKKLGIEGFIKNLLSPMNIKTIEKKEEKIYRIRTRSRYTLIVKETKKEMKVLSIYYQNREKVRASF